MMRKKKSNKPLALGYHIYAGGFSLGVRRAGFQLAGHLEDWNFGVETSKKNLGVPVWTPDSQWDEPLDKYHGVPLLYGNPPCASWSQAGQKVLDTEKNKDRWKHDSRTDCTRKLFSLVEKIEPKILIWECVAAAMKNGLEFVNEQADYMRSLGYEVHLVLFNVMDLGVPQTRKRFFFVASKYRFEIEKPTVAHVLPGEMWVDDPEGRKVKTGSAVVELLKLSPKDPDKVVVLHKIYNDKWGDNYPRNERGHAKGRPGFLHMRLSYRMPCPTITGGQHLYHPTKNRAITPWEQKRLCGFPDDYEFSGSHGGQYAEIGKGVLPAAGEWIARAAFKALQKRGQARQVTLTHDFIGDLGKRAPKKAALAECVSTRRPKKLKKKRRREGTLDNHQDLNAPKSHPRTDRGSRKFDKTQLKVFAAAGKHVHRDYAAHWFRWGFATRFVKKNMEVLDIGCGQEQPLVRVLCHHQACVPSRYVGVDLNKIKKKTGIAWTEILDEFDFTRNYKRINGLFDVITCFEVIEHMREKDGDKLLKAISYHLRPETGRALLSTPVYNEKHMAANHIREYRHDELKEKIEAAGLVIEKRYGTFMTSQNIKKCCTPEERKIIDALSEWYSWDILACFLAPLYPEYANNCCWVISRPRLEKKLRKKRKVRR